MSEPIMAITGTREQVSVSCESSGRARRTLRSWASRIVRSGAYGSIAVLPMCVHAETWRFDPSLGVEETLTNNVNLTANNIRRGDLVTQLTPGFRVIETGAHTSSTGSVSVPVLLYARTGSENNKVQPQVNLLGTWEAVDRFFFLESAINVDQQYVTAFGPTSESLANATNNRYTSQSYRLSPYIKG